MSEELITKLINEAISQSLVGNYKFYLLFAAITFLSASASYFVSSYLKQRGQNFATKADFNQIVEQLRETTTVTESIKSDITSKLHEESNLKSLLREKVEHIFDETFRLELWLEQSRSNALRGNLPDTNASPIAKIEMYQAIYFKELNVALLNLQSSYYPMIEFILKTASKSSPSNPVLLDDFNRINEPLFTNLRLFRTKLLEIYAPKIGL